MTRRGGRQSRPDPPRPLAAWLPDGLLLLSLGLYLLAAVAEAARIVGSL